MTIERENAEVIQEREGYPFGKPRPYTPDHPNHLVDKSPVYPPESLRLFSGIARLMFVLVAVLATAYGVHGLITDDLYLPAKRSPGIHYRGYHAWLVFGMIVSFSAWLVTAAFDEMDVEKRRLKHHVLLACLATSGMLFMLVALASYTLYPSE